MRLRLAALAVSAALGLAGMTTAALAATGDDDCQGYVCRPVTSAIATCTNLTIGIYNPTPAGVMVTLSPGPDGETAVDIPVDAGLSERIIYEAPVDRKPLTITTTVGGVVRTHTWTEPEGYSCVELPGPTASPSERPSESPSPGLTPTSRGGGIHGALPDTGVPGWLGWALFGGMVMVAVGLAIRWAFRDDPQ